MANPPHPGQVFKRMYLDPLNLNITDTANKLKVSRKTLSEFVNGKRGLSIELAMRIAKAFNTELEMWLNMQMQYEVAQCKKEINISDVEIIYPQSA